jgi:DNA helicase-2/ATP-dependent DNA helicase PcrA
MIFGIVSHNKPSRFSEEIPKDLVEFTAVRNVKKFERKDGFQKVYFEEKKRLIDSARSFNDISQMTHKKYIISFEKGDLVSHKIFGKGQILSSTPMGNDNLLEIEFDGTGIKKLMANFSNLTKVTS